MDELDLGQAGSDVALARESIDQLATVVDLVARGRAGVARARVVGVPWTWTVARQVQAHARERGVTVWLVDESGDGRATVEVAGGARHEGDDSGAS